MNLIIAAKLMYGLCVRSCRCDGPSNTDTQVGSQNKPILLLRLASVW